MNKPLMQVMSVAAKAGAPTGYTTHKIKSIYYVAI